MGNSRSQPQFESDTEMTPEADTTKRCVSVARFGTGTSAQWELCIPGPVSQNHHQVIAPTSSSDPVLQHRALVSVTVELRDKLQPNNQIRRVLPFFKQKRCDVYQPSIISLGPYHYGKHEYRLAEGFKNESLKAFLSKGRGSESFFRSKILSRIQEVRNCYEGVEFDNDSLAQLMLRDACFIIFTMELTSKNLSQAHVTSYISYFGIGAMNFIERDMLLLENQIPFWIIKLITCSPSDLGHIFWKKLLLDHMTAVTSKELPTLPWENDEGYEPFHYLDALRYYYMMPIKKLETMERPPTKYAGDINKQANRQTPPTKFPSVTDLKAEGIRVKPNVSSILFSSGQLTLPSIHVSINFFVLFSNFLAYEIFPTSNARLYATSYVNLLKSLIETPNDAKILRKAGILFSDIGNDIEVVQLIKDLHTSGVERSGVFMDLKTSITDHCSPWSRSKYTWKRELINTYFRSPWSIIAMLAAAFLLILTFLQTLFTIRQRS